MLMHVHQHTKSAPGIGLKVFALAACLATLSVAEAETVAYWRFEGDGVNPLTAGTPVLGTQGHSTLKAPGSHGIPVPDVSGNGNTLYTWNEGEGGHQYVEDVPAGTVPRSGLPNRFSLQNRGSSPATFTWSQQSHPGKDVESIAPLAWTVQASIKATKVDNNFHTFIGRGGTRVVTGEPRLASFYFQVDNQKRFALKFADQAGFFFRLLDTEQVDVDRWYHVAAVSDGRELKLYKDALDGRGYRLMAATNLSVSPQPAMVKPAVDQNGDTWSWTIGYCRYGERADPAMDRRDWFNGFIDEVAIDDTALAPEQFLFALRTAPRQPPPAVPSAAAPAAAGEPAAPAPKAARSRWANPLMYIIPLALLVFGFVLVLLVQLTLLTRRIKK
jgi:hypothetical protein